MFLRNCWYVAGWSHHFLEDGLVARTILDEPIVLYRKRDGGMVALEDRCLRRCRAAEKRATISAACITG
jgi:phenylpropionate dioxygenase-like ring-hydroxylating dioxygenase large terminal subunit